MRVARDGGGTGGRREKESGKGSDEEGEEVTFWKKRRVREGLGLEDRRAGVGEGGGGDDAWGVETAE